MCASSALAPLSSSPGPPSGPSSSSSKMAAAPPLLHILCLWNRTLGWPSVFNGCHINQQIKNAPSFDLSEVSPAQTQEPKFVSPMPPTPTLSSCRAISYRKVEPFGQGKHELFTETGGKNTCRQLVKNSKSLGRVGLNGQGGKGKAHQEYCETCGAVPPGYTLRLDQCPQKKMRMEKSFRERKLESGETFVLFYFLKPQTRTSKAWQALLTFTKL